MKIAFVTPWYGEFAGGAEIVARKAAENLSNNGVDVEILTTCSRSPFDSWWKDYYKQSIYKINNITIRRFSVNKHTEDMYHKVNYKIINNIRLSREDELEYLRGSISSDAMISFIEANKEKYIFVLTPYLYGLTYWAFKGASERCVLIPCLHDESQAYFNTTKEMIDNSKVLFYTQEEMMLAKRICGRKDGNFEIIGGGVELYNRFEPEPFLKKYKVDYEYILYVGRKDRGKNIDRLIDYFDLYKKMEKDNLRLVFIGGGDSSLIPKKKHFIDFGYIDENDKNSAYSGALATCLLSNNESFSLVIMESWLSSRPVIVSDNCPVTKSHCKRSNGGLFVADSEEFRAVIKYLKKHRHLADKMGLNGREYVLNNYTWDKIIPKYIKIFKGFGGGSKLEF
jgi:glycosyltransferase involved in cell wall biosynthesis